MEGTITVMMISDIQAKEYGQKMAEAMNRFNEVTSRQISYLALYERQDAYYESVQALKDYINLQREFYYKIALDLARTRSFVIVSEASYCIQSSPGLEGLSN